MNGNGGDSDRSEVAALRVMNDLLHLWRLCGNARCRRSRACRGGAHLCVHRNYRALPQGVRDFCMQFLAAKSVGVPFESFKNEMERRPETMALCAWRRAARATPRTGRASL
jgi:hypothetical protein